MIGKVLAAAAGGAGLAYLFDPDRGRTRRARLRDQALATWRRDVRALERKANFERGKLEGMTHRATHRGEREPASDQVLVDKIRSEALGRAPELAHRISIDACKGVVTLRGQLDTPEDVARVEALVAPVSGVQRVVNLAHLPGEAAPNKADALRMAL